MADIYIPNIWEGKEVCICITAEKAVFVCDLEKDKFVDTGLTAQELPPHGDLISRDEVKKSLSALFRAYLPSKQETKAYKIINEAPNIIEASEERKEK